MRHFRVLAAVAVVAVATGMASPVADARPRPHTIVFNGEDNRLNAYDVTAHFKKQNVIPSHADDPVNGRDINAQICFFPDGSRRFIAGEDTGQGTAEGQPGWGIFQLAGDRVGAFSASQVGKLITTYQTSDNPDERQPYESNPENYGCGFLSDGRVVTTDVGNENPGTPSNGQLTIWFPDPVTGFQNYSVSHCKIDIGIPTAGGVYIDEQDRVYVAASRPSAPSPDRPAGVYRYTGPFPTSNTPAGGCDSTDGTGAPMTTQVNRELFIPAVPGTQLSTPSAIVRSPSGGFYVSSVFDGRIGEFTATGAFTRLILQPAPGQQPPYSTGTPYGIGIDSGGSLFYADLGVESGPPPGPGDHNGTVRRIRFQNGLPLPPETMDTGLNFPDGIGILEI